jgi:hypothetical protein
VGGAIGESAQVVAALHGFLGDPAKPALECVDVTGQQSEHALLKEAHVISHVEISAALS